VNGYIESGYIVTLGALGVYAASLVGRERSARRRLPAPPARGTAPAEAPEDAPAGDEGSPAPPPGSSGTGA
jgi:hypothetical protein